MKKGVLILGIILLLLGVLGLCYDQITLKKTGQTELGPLSLKYPHYQTYNIPHWLSGGLIIAGGILILFNLKRR
jgi:hypothetical protein